MRAEPKLDGRVLQFETNAQSDTTVVADAELISIALGQVLDNVMAHTPPGVARLPRRRGSRVTRPEDVFGDGPDRAGAADQELNVHRGRSARLTEGSGVIARSMATRWATTSTGFGRRLVSVGQRATWFRWLPMRAICRVRSRSAPAAPACAVWAWAHIPPGCLS